MSTNELATDVADATEKQSDEANNGPFHRRAIRYFAALVTGATAVIYFLIGLQIIIVLDTPSDQVVFGFAAGAMYALGVFLLLAFDRRVVWILGALLQIFVIYMYFNLAPQRSPSYENWGILLRVIQVVLLIALAYLVGRAPLKPNTEPDRYRYN